jgi:hypothetical protein
MIKGRGVGVTAFFCFMFSWVELLLLARAAGVQSMPVIARHHDAHGIGRHGLGRC